MAHSIILVAKTPKSKRTHYGVVYPDGTIDWNRLRLPTRPTGSEIQTAIAKVESEYAIECERLKVTPNRKLIFIKRKVVTTYSTPELI